MSPRPWVLGLRLSADLHSIRVLRSLELDFRERRAPSPAVEANLRPLSGRPVWLRPGTSDIAVARETFVDHHNLPPPEADLAEISTILDLGSNVGLSVAHLAHVCPRARILGVELDADNVRLARKNLSAWQSRCEVIHGAVWSHPGAVRYRPTPGREYGTRVIEPGDSGYGAITVPAYTINEIVERLLEGPADVVDYLKMDIEGAEAEVLRTDAAWARRIRLMKVEVHRPYSVERCMADVRALGFRVRRDDHHGATVVAVGSAARA